MKKIAFVPKIFLENNKLSDRVRHFFRAVERKLDFDVYFKDKIEACDADVLLIYAGVHGKELAREALNIKKPKKIFILTGLHSFDKSLIERIVDSSSLVFVTYKSYFDLKFREFSEKVFFFPLYFAPYERYSKLKPMKDPILKCLITGHSNPKVYPVRHELKLKIKQNKNLWNLFDVARHPRWSKNKVPLKEYELAPVINESYAKLLNRYFCSLATDSKYRYGLAKYFEIPASGCLLLAIETDDIQAVGFRPWVHFVPVERNNIVERVGEVIKNPEGYTDIRQQGREFVLKNHSVLNRINELKSYMERL